MAKPEYIDSDLRYHPFVSPCNFNLDFTTKTYWWTTVWEKRNLFPILEDNNLLQKFVNDMRFNNAYLIVDYSMEAINLKFLEDNYLSSIFDFFKHFSIDFHRLIVLTASPDEFYFDSSTTSLNMYIHSNKHKRPYKHFFFNSLFQHTKIKYLTYNEEIQFRKQPVKHFMSLAYRDTIPRMLVNTFLHENNLFSSNFVSHNRVLENDDKTDKNKFNMVKSIFANEQDFNPISFLKYGFLKHRIDTPSTKINATYPFSWQFSLSSKVCFELINETSVAQNKRFITEKIFKSILSKNVFLLVGNPHSLKWLKSLGFKTFSDIINEEYDNEEIFFKRLLLLFEEVKRLCTYEVDVLFSLIKKLDDVVEHNYQHYINTVWDFGVSHNIQLHINENTND